MEDEVPLGLWALEARGRLREEMGTGEALSTSRGAGGMEAMEAAQRVMTGRNGEGKA